MTKQEIIELIKRKKDACELALLDLYALDEVTPNDESIKIDIIRLEEQIDTYKYLLQEIY